MVSSLAHAAATIAPAGLLGGHIVSATPVARGPFGLFLIPNSHEFGWPRVQVSGVPGVARS